MFANVRKEIRNYILMGVLCIPLFFINVRDWTDWGDDFAQYMHQANNLVAGIPQNETGYIFNEDYPTYAPSSYPAGFPVLLAPVIKWKGYSIYHLNLYMSAFLFILALTLFAFLKRYYSGLMSIILVALFVYNPWTLSFKAEIISDIPFTLFILMLTMLFTSMKKRNFKFLIFFSALCAFTILIRSIGIAFITAIIVQTAADYYNYRKSKSVVIEKDLLFNISIAASSAVLYFILNKFIFPVSEKGVLGYSKIIDTANFFDTIQTNLNYYTGVLRAFFEPWNDRWNFVSIISASMIFTFIILGMIRKMATNYDFIDSLFIAYLIVIIVYPYSNAGFRFLLPLTPVFLVYLSKGILSIDMGIKLNRKATLIILGAIVLFSYKKGITEAYKSGNIISEGPQVKENAEMLRYVIDSTSADARFSFKRPRALALYTGRSGMTHRKEATPEEIENNIVKNRIDYILINTEDYNQNMIDYVNANANRIKKVWENSKNSIYRIEMVN